MNICRKIVLFAAVALLPLVTSGCPAVLLGGAALGSAAAYSMGRLTATRNVTLPQAWQASQRALEELGVLIVGKEKDGLTALIVARGAEDKQIKVRMEKIFDDVTRIDVRVGLIGNELQSRIIFDKIEEHLAAKDSSQPAAPSPRLP